MQTLTHTTTARPMAARSLLNRARAAVRWPFTNRYASPLWLAMRLYLGYLWFQFGLTKLQAGWLTSDPVGGMLKLVADGTLQVPFEWYRPVAQFLIDMGMTPLLSYSMPFLEFAVALSFVSGVLVIPAAIGATLLNINFILSGIGQPAYDGRFIVMQLLMIMAFRIVSLIGFEKLALHILHTVLRALRIMRPAPVHVTAQNK